LLANGQLTSGVYQIDPDGDAPGEPFTVYCDMDTEGGGWTLLGNFVDSAFDVNDPGGTNQLCFAEPCANRAYSTVPLGPDLLIEWAGASIVGSTVEGRGVFSGIEPKTAGRSLRAIFLAPSPSFLQTQSTVAKLTWLNGKSCTSWPNWGAAICQPNVQAVFQDPSGCNSTIFQIGLGSSFSMVKDNCDGWPQHPGMNFPHAFRFWTR